MGERRETNIRIVFDLFKQKVSPINKRRKNPIDNL